MIQAIGKEPWEYWNASKQPGPAPGSDDGGTAAKAAFQGGSVRQQDCSFQPFFVMSGDIIPRNPAAIQLPFHQIQGGWFHASAVDCNAIQKLLSVSASNEFRHSSQI